MKDFLQVTLLIFGFVAILFIAYLVTRFMGTRISNFNSTRHMKVLDRVILGNDKSICIIQVGKRFLIVGITGHNIRLLSEIAETDIIPLTTHSDNSFGNMFEMYRDKLFKNKDSYTEDQGRIQQIKLGLEKQKDNIRNL